MENYNKIKNSLLWSVYGDALGFITELSDKKNLKYRTNGLDRITNLISWKRKIGGLYGVNISLPKGCYSDDSQLRLAVCRSIKKDGKLDFETFSKIELPVFLAYGLGKGKGTRAACESLQKISIQWNTNFFDNKNAKYLNMGGNGVAMRIQPHIWIADEKTSDDEVISEIMRNSIITHGNPIAWLGAVFHGLVLKHTFEHNECPHPDLWPSILGKSKRLIDVCRRDTLLKDIWLPSWERISNQKIENAVEISSENMLKDINTILNSIHQLSNTSNSSVKTEDFYHSLVKSIDAFNPKLSGSAIKTSLLSSFLGYYYSSEPKTGLIYCANTLGSDTDTIATMAGSILGACTKEEPPEEILDIEYHKYQAQMLFNIKNGKAVTQFNYPDLLYWKLPVTTLDFVGSYNNKMVISGFGELIPENNIVFQKRQRNTSIWQFAKTTFGQTLLINHREELKPLGLSLFATNKSQISSNELEKKEFYNLETNMKNLKNKEQKQIQDEPSIFPPTINEATDNIIRNGFNETEIGKQLLKYAEDEDGIEKAISFSSIIVKAKMARIKKSKN